VGGLLGGCSGTDAADVPTATAGADGSHSVRLSPVGDVAFGRVPETAFTVFPQYADMAVALGHGDVVNAMYVPEMSGTTMNHYYRRLDGVSFEWSGLYDPLSDGFPKEQLYRLGSDVHLVDPAWVSTQDAWSRSDVEEVASRIGPWFGNFYSGTRATPPDGYDDYAYYSLWDLFEKVSRVFDERARFEALAEVHADLVSTIRADLPPESERPTVVRATLGADGESFYTYHLNEPGYWLADTRPLGAVDAFADEDWGSLWETVDYETMLDADPDVFLHLWGLTPNHDMAAVRRSLATHEVGRELTAVQNDRVYPAGMRYQGPIMNLFQLEMGAKQLYPDRFGEWPRYEDGDPYPTIPEDERLFDRQRVADIAAGGDDR
jgi:hypothetical protein